MRVDFDIVVGRAPSTKEGVDVASLPFLAECQALEVKAEGKTKPEAVDACEKAILAKLLAVKPKADVVPASEAPTEHVTKKPAKG
jgi:hypothetical protein